MTQFPNSARYRTLAARVATEHLLTTTVGAGLSPTADVQSIAYGARTSNPNMRNAQVGFNPIRPMKSQAQAKFHEMDSRQIMTQVLSGIRRSGSTARTMRVRGLGAVDCSTVNPAQWSREQTDMMVALFLSTLGTSDMLSHFANVPGSQCWAEWIAAQPEISDTTLGKDIVTALKAQGWLPGVDVNTSTVVPFFAKLAAYSNLTVARALELTNCGAGITKANAWGDYVNQWAATQCMRVWYENPWYIGAGAAVLIGGVWFATRKKKG